MHSTMKFVGALVMLASALASAYSSDVKLRRDGMLNLYPFPRVGRNMWQIPLDDYYPDLELLSSRRQQENHMYPHPRIGRSTPAFESPLDLQPVAVRRTDSPGMWFGPRLGRSFKSNDDLSIQFANEVSEPEQTNPLHDVRRKRDTLN